MRSCVIAFALLFGSLAFGQGVLPPRDPQKRHKFELLNADHTYTFDAVNVHVEGNVRVLYRGYEIQADKLVGNRKTEVFRLEGDGRLIGKGSDIFGDVIIINFKDDTFEFEDGKARLSPETLKGAAKEDVYITTSAGAGNQQLFEVRDGLFTTCDKFDPHFKFTAQSMRIKPGKYAALSHVRLDILGHTIFGVPYLVIPLIEDGRRYLPDVGQDPTEGYFIKTRFSTPLKGDDYFDTRIDYMTNLGTGLGIDYNYDRKNLEGRFEAYTIVGQQTSSTVISSHAQEIGPGRLQLNARYQQQNYLTAPQTTQFNTRAQYVVPWGDGISRLSWYRVSNDRSSFSSISQSFALNDNRTWDSGLSTRMNLNLARSETSSTSNSTDSKRLDIRFNGRQQFRSFAADLMYQRSLPVGDSDGFFSTTDRTPMLTLTTDSRRLLSSEMARVLPFNSSFSIGELADPASGGQITRMNFDFGLGRTERKGNSSFQWGGRYEQGLYSDDTAQYVLDYNSKLSYRFGGRSRVDLSYRNHRAFGFTPLSIDRTGRNDAFAFDFVWEASRRLNLSARTGYDVLQSDRGRVPWQQVWFRTDWRASDAWQVKTSSIYDTFNQVWSNIRLDAFYDQGDFQIGFGAKYDARRSVWGNANIVMQGLKVGKTTIATALNWNGYLGRFDATHLQLIYSLHKAEAVLDIIDNRSGFRSGQQFALFIRLKAFPTRSNFGSGTRGQAIGSQSGFGF